MRLSITLPDEYYNYWKDKLNSAGYSTFSEFICDLLRHTSSGAEVHHNTVKTVENVETGAEVHHKIQNAAQAKQAVKTIKVVGLCEHGCMPQLCKHNKCREAYNKAH